MIDNKTVYESKRISRDYFGKAWLFPTEKELIQSSAVDLSGFHMLDVGIGGGRTTTFYAPKVKYYVGIDYSSTMIQHCKKKFAKYSHAEFEVMDARNMAAFPDAHFDMILFSFNGIDCVDYEGRRKILSEFHRVLKPNGLLMFSFHNARHLHRLYSFQMPKNPLKIFSELKRKRKLLEINGNPERYEGKESFSLFDGADHFQTCILYLIPERQKSDLMNAGFQVIAWNDMVTGRSISEEEWKALTIHWIIVQARKQP